MNATIPWLIIFLIFQWLSSGHDLNLNITFDGGGINSFCRFTLNYDAKDTVILKRKIFRLKRDVISESKNFECVLCRLNSTRNYAATKRTICHIIYHSLYHAMQNQDVHRQWIISAKGVGKRRAKTKTRVSRVIFLSVYWIQRNKNISRLDKDKITHEILKRNKRNILGNRQNTTTFPKHFHNTSSYTNDVTRQTTTAQNKMLITSSEITTFCNNSLPIISSTITSYLSTINRSHQTQVISPSSNVFASMLHNLTGHKASNYLSKTTSVTKVNSAIHSNSRITATKSTITTSKNLQQSCITQPYVTTTKIKPSQMTTKRNNIMTRKQNKLFVGLIAGGCVVSSIIIAIAMFLLVKRYKRIQAKRRTEKQISYFNRYEGTSPWDESEQFRDSKLSVFTLKDSKFDIDWDSSNDIK
ncbi:uncharacterized protein LOC124438905 [Xenia sp. Carnegie-2017]|uniref:uncharacterized protein LOC124438905 n=1 Tax=Xenia sp. Carnegie-2017 TaxID=2897299 RepID=UPI001F04EEA8|nr:uncharacterized protein LOC124438905 [Xenia sp. Carnegie-2017]